VDAHVGRHIFTQCFLTLLSSKTIVLMTHKLDILPAAQQVVVMGLNAVKDVGPYSELIARGHDFGLEEGKGGEGTGGGGGVAGESAKKEEGSDGKGGGEGKGGARKAGGGLMTAEERATGSVAGFVYKEYFGGMGWLFVALIAIFGVASQFARIGTDWWLSHWAATGSRDVGFYLAIYGGWTVAQVVVIYLRDITLTVSELRTSTKLNKKMLGAVMRSPMSFFETTPVGRIQVPPPPLPPPSPSSPPPMSLQPAPLPPHLVRMVTTNCCVLALLPPSPPSPTPPPILTPPHARFSKDQDVLDNALPRTLAAAFNSALAVATAAATVVVASPPFLLPLAPLAALYFRVQRLFRHTSREITRIGGGGGGWCGAHSRAESNQRGPIYSHFNEALNGASTIRAFGAVAQFAAENRALLDHLGRASINSIAANRWLAVRLEFCGNCIVSMAAFCAVLGRMSGWLSHDSATLVGLSLTFALSVTATLTWMVRMTADAEANMNSVERVLHYGTLPGEEGEGAEGAADGWPRGGEVVFEGVVMRYREDLGAVLNGVSLRIGGGEKVGVCGRTGAGKSSLIAALFRLVNLAGGRVLIDGTDIATVALDDLRQRLAIVPQDPVLFTGTIRWGGGGGER
jgi:ABC-type multidrug transport system fused ATPase/permease subunit